MVRDIEDGDDVIGKALVTVNITLSINVSGRKHQTIQRLRWDVWDGWLVEDWGCADGRRGRFGRENDIVRSDGSLGEEKAGRRDRSRVCR